MDVEAVAQHFGVKVSWVREQTRNRRIPHYKVGHYVRFRIEELEDRFTPMARKTA